MGKKSNNAIVNYDTILDHIGQFGPWQQRIHFLLWLTSAAGGLAVVVYSFTAFKTPYICKPPRCESDEITYNGTAKAFVRYICISEILFLSNHNIHKSSCGLCFWASDPLIDRFYYNFSIKVSEAQK